jgi:hypothetical protein
VKISLQNTSIINDTVICAGDVIQLWANGGNTYNWLPENTLSGNNLPNPTVYPQQKTTYFVEIGDSGSSCKVKKSVTVNVDKDCVWPGDANRDKYVNFKDVLYLGLGFKDTGSARKNASASWFPQHAINWQNAVKDTLNYKHFDADGNGKIDFNDLSVVQDNYFLKHNYIAIPYTEPFSGIPLYVKFNKDTFYAGETVTAHFILGDNISFPEKLYGAGLQFEIHCAVSEANTGNISFDNNFFTNTASGEISHTNLDDSVSEFAIVRSNQTNANGFGELATFQLKLLDSTRYNYAPQGEKLKLKITDALAIDNAGNIINLKLKSDSAIVFKAPKIVVPEPKIIPAYKIFPIPSQEKITIESNVNLNTPLLIIDNLGKTISRANIKGSKTVNLDLSEFRSGIYMLQFLFDNKLVTERIVLTE